MTRKVNKIETYRVVINQQDQVAYWPADLLTPLGWKDVGREGTKGECLKYIEEVWTDMRPLDLYSQMKREGLIK